MATAEEITEIAPRLVAREGGLVPFIRNVGFGSVAYAFILQLVEIIQGSGLILFGPVRALGRGTILLVDATFGGLADVFGAGTATTIRSFQEGTGALLGPLAQPGSVGVIILTLAIFMWGINRVSFSPLSFMQSLRR